jgi:autotransporter-associated beta strand protein
LNPFTPKSFLMPHQNQRALRTLTLPFFLLAATQLHAGEIIKANNGTALNTTGAWSAGVVPGSGDIAVWDSTTTADRTNVIGGNLSFGGIKVTDAGGTTHAINSSTGFVLTLGSSGIDMSSATANLSISAIMDLSASQTWTVASGRTLNVSGTNTGAGTISLAGTGTFGVNNNSALGTGNVNLGSGITFTTSNVRSLANAVKLDGNIALSLTGATNNNLNLNGGVDLGSGNRTITLSNPNMVWSASDTATNFMLNFGGTSTQLTGTGSLTLANSGASSMVGVRFGTANYVQTDVTVGSGVAVSFSAAQAFTNNGGLTVDSGGRFSLSSGGNTAASQTLAYLAGAGTITKDANPSYVNGATLTIDGSVKNTDATFSGVIQDGTGTVSSGARVSITKTGGTKQVFSGDNTYTGQTLVSGGSLYVNGTHIESATVSGVGYNGASAGHYQVASGATLGGSGRIAGFNATTNANMVLVQAGGFLAPGGDSALGTMVLDGGNITGTTARVLNMASGAKFDFTLSGNGGSPDQLAFWNFASGDLLLNSNAVDLSLSGPQTAGTYTVSLFKFFSDAGVSVVSSGIASGLTIGTLGAGIESASITYNASSIDLTYTVAAIPEPATYAVLLGALALCCAGLRRRSGRA